MIARKPTAYSRPSVTMAFRRWRPVRKATSSSAGVGKRPWVASAAATIIASEVAGSSASARAGPINGTMLISDMPTMARIKIAARAMGWRQKVWTPSLTHWTPVRAGTIWSFMKQSKSWASSSGRFRAPIALLYRRLF